MTAASRPTLTSPASGDSLYRRLLALATVLAFAVVGLGAYVRLADAGLGCPDWPGCYGHLLGVPEAPHDQAAAAAAFPGKPLDAGKAWTEMTHRYLAGSLGLLILALCVFAWRGFLAARRAGRHRTAPPPWLETGLLLLVGLQAALGMWTVTLLLKPAIVTAHLLGGMATWTLLVALSLRAAGRSPALPAGVPRWLRVWGNVAFLAVFAQIALGGWVSSHYAGLACPDFPTCRGNWLPADALSAIHWTHRLGALGVGLIAGGFALALLGIRPLRSVGLALLLLLALQIGLGIANVRWQLPLPLAVAHNLGAALLLAAALTARWRLGATSR